MLADKRNDKKMAAFLRKWYWKHKQVLIFDTFEVRTKDSCAYDVCLWDPIKKESHKFMFTMDNYKGRFDCFLDASGNVVMDVFDSCTASCMPFYFDGHFFIRTWKPLKTEDIYRCAKFFVDKALGLKYRIWNIRVNEHVEQDSEQLLTEAEEAV